MTDDNGEMSNREDQWPQLIAQLREHLLVDVEFQRELSARIQREPAFRAQIDNYLAALNPKGEQPLSPPGGESDAGAFAATVTSRKSIGGSQAQLALVHELSNRVEALEGAMHGNATSGHDAVFGSDFSLADEVRRLKVRFEYLERIAPTDVQRALQFFEPLRDHHDDQMGSSNGMSGADRTASSVVGSAAVMRKVGELQKQQLEAQESTKALVENGHHEVMNVSQVLRGVQRDSEINRGKIDDLKHAVGALRSHIDTTLPQVLQVIQGIVSKGLNLPVGVDAQLENIRHAVEEGATKDHSVPHPFVSQQALRETVEQLQKFIYEGLYKLHAEIESNIRGKADSHVVKCLSEQLTEHEKQFPLMRRALQDVHPERLAEGAALSRWGEMRCVSCNSKVDYLHPGGSSTAGLQNRGFPARGGKNLKNIRSLPELPSVPHTSSPHTLSPGPMPLSGSQMQRPIDSSLP
jgi:hypothetical protein